MKSDCANPSYRQSSLGLKRSLGFSGHRQQQGMALIVVLLVLILIISIGAVAVRRSQTDLRLVSSSQMDTLLLQGADGANMRLEEAVNLPVTDMVNRNNGIFGHFISNSPDADQDELIYCYNPRMLQINTKTATIKRDGGLVVSNHLGICDPKQASSYLSARQTVATQVHITRTPLNNLRPFEGARQEVNLSAGNQDLKSKHVFDIGTVSAIPSYNHFDNCYSDVSNVGAVVSDHLSNCLKNHNVPNKQLKEQVEVSLANQVQTCIGLGRASSATLKNDDKCKPISDGTTGTNSKPTEGQAHETEKP